MKIRPFLFFLLFLPLLFAFSERQTTAVVEWLTPIEHDFGDLEKGKPVHFTFRMRNLSNEPQVIDNVRTACGCTAPSWSPEPIPPDSTAAIDVEYDARDDGYFRRYVKVYLSGQRKAEKLWIEGYVME